MLYGIITNQWCQKTSEPWYFYDCMDASATSFRNPDPLDVTGYRSGWMATFM